MILFTCGSTGGHVYPAIAVAQELEMPCYFIVAKDRAAADILNRHGFSYIEFPEKPYRLLQLFRIYAKSKAWIEANKPELIVATGGMLTLPVALAGYRLGVPIMGLEQNTIPGRVNRILQHLATTMCLTFEESIRYFKPDKVRLTGNPVRKVYLADTTSDAFSALALSDDPTLLVFGGSQGSLAINKLVYDHYTQFLNLGYNVIHLTGTTFYQQRCDSYQPLTITKSTDNACQIVTMPYFEKMDMLYAKTDVVICRAGATSIAELFAFHKPAILIPYPHAKDNHQDMNALAMEKTGLGFRIVEKDLNFTTIVTTIRKIQKHPPTIMDSNLFHARETIAKAIRDQLG